MPQVVFTCGIFCTIMKIEIGKIVKAQGIKGEVKIQCYVDDSTMLKSVKTLYVGTTAYAVASIRCDGRFCYVLLTGVDNRNMAESLRDWQVFADKESLKLKEQCFFVQDLVGSTVSLDDGRLVGVLDEVLQYGSADVFVCKAKKAVSFPFLKDLALDVDVENKKILLNAKRFDEVAVYDED